MPNVQMKFDKHGKLCQLTAPLAPDHLVRVTKRRKDWQYRIYRSEGAAYQQIAEGEGITLEAAPNIARSIVVEV